jgi:hypothetical protein
VTCIEKGERKHKDTKREWKANKERENGK